MNNVGGRMCWRSSSIQGHFQMDFLWVGVGGWVADTYNLKFNYLLSSKLENNFHKITR